MKTPPAPRPAVVSSPVPAIAGPAGIAFLLAPTLAWLTVTASFAADDAPSSPAAASPEPAAGSLDPVALRKAVTEGDYDRVIALTTGLPRESPLLPYRAAAFQRRGIEHFFAARIDESIADFDAYLELNPEDDPHHWQRGISYYYADQFEKGKAQFERHQTVNSQDVENAVFHFICAARAPGGSAEKARADFIDIRADPRVPMTEIWALYAGESSPEEVLAAARAGDPSEDELRNRLCYAHLYLGLYHEALGEPEKSAEHIILAAGKYRMDHYMGQVAQVHARLRGLEVPE